MVVVVVVLLGHSQVWWELLQKGFAECPEIWLSQNIQQDENKGVSHHDENDVMLAFLNNAVWLYSRNTSLYKLFEVAFSLRHLRHGLLFSLYQHGC